ncbi:MAG: non-ribosomal peptide synthetase, partial [Candidatus Binatia bacterium]
MTPARVGGETAKFDLTLSIHEQAEGLQGRLQYNTDLFNPETITRLVGHFEMLLEGVVVNPNQPISALPILTAAAKHQLLVEWNETEKASPIDKCIHELFEQQVQSAPDATAVIFEDKQLTYRELNSRANQLAHHLKGHGVGPEARVALCMDRSLEMFVGLLGVLKTGGAYVPLEPDYPDELLRFMLEDIHTSILLTQQRFADHFCKTNARVICLDRDWETIGRESERNPGDEPATNALAYVIYTSGSTGRPKGVAVEHRQIVNYSAGIIKQLNIATGNSFAMVQPLTVDASLTVVFISLLTGGALHVIPREQALNPSELADYFSRRPIDILKIAPSHLAALQAAGRAEELMPRRWLVIGGEESRWDWIQSLRALNPDCAILNHYGPTETTVGVLTYQVQDAKPHEDYSKTPLGRPINNTQVFVLDSLLQPVPIGVPGELYVGGCSLARGYLNRPDLTAERFIPNPFADVPGERLYKTGDLCRYLVDGNVEFLGRADSQVKIRGFRIEPGEIEATLNQHPDVQQVAVVAEDDALGQKRLVAYVVPNPERAPTSINDGDWIFDVGANVDAPERLLTTEQKERSHILPLPVLRDAILSPGELRSFVSAKLAEHMVPSVFVMLESMPLTPHGKLNRRGLALPENLRADLGGTYAAPRNTIEERLAKIWAELLSLDAVGIHDNFFELGGHSLLAIQLISRIRGAFNAELPVRTLFESPRIVDLARSIDTLRQKVTGGESAPMAPASVDEDVPLSFTQERFWLLNQMDPKLSAYNGLH